MFYGSLLILRRVVDNHIEKVTTSRATQAHLFLYGVL